MNISLGRNTDPFDREGSGSVFAGNSSIFHNTGLKSAQEKAQRQQKTAGQIDFWENQKNGLKNMECGTPEEIARKLEMFHTYENEIAAAKAAYNSEQMFHTLDEARELGEKIAEAAEKLEPKTAEERKREIAEEAMGTEESGGMLEEMFEEVEAVMEEMEEELAEEAARQAADSLKETAEQAKDLVAAEGIAAGPEELQYGSDELTKYEWIQNYRPLDIRV